MENQSKPNTDPREKTPGQLERDISQTRQAIGADLRALGEKLSPEVLKEEAREVIQDAKEGAKEVIRDARDAAADSLRSAKEQALGAVSETVDDIKDEARRVTRATTQFVGRNAVPLTLIGLGVGWLMLTRKQDYSYPRSYGQSRQRSFADPETSRLGGHSADSTMSVVRRKIMHVGEQSMATARDLGGKAAHLSQDLSHGAVEQWQRGRDGVMDLARDNPLAVGAAVLAAGAGVGLLLPMTRVENEWLGPTRDQLLNETKELAGELRETTERLGRGAREAMTEVRQATGAATRPGV
jgi:hypothetical protein